MKPITREFHRDETAELTRLLKGKTIQAVYTEDGANGFLCFRFSDNSYLKLEYDWIYEWTVVVNE